MATEQQRRLNDDPEGQPFSWLLHEAPKRTTTAPKGGRRVLASVERAGYRSLFRQLIRSPRVVVEPEMGCLWLSTVAKAQIPSHDRETRLNGPAWRIQSEADPVFGARIGLEAMP
jgi:hypothetical protein